MINDKNKDKRHKTGTAGKQYENKEKNTKKQGQTAKNKSNRHSIRKTAGKYE